MLKSSLLFLAAVLVAAICLPLAGRNPQAAAQQHAQAKAKSVAPSSNPVASAVESQAQAKAIYKRDCAMCHGETGNGKSDLAAGMNLTLDDWTASQTLAGKSDDDLFAIVRQGKNQMPSEDTGRANDAEVRNLIVYIRGFAKAQPPAAVSAPAAQ